MPFNPQIFDIAGGLQQGMMSGAAGLSRGLEKLTERQQELADEDRKRARVAESTRKILVESGLATEDQVKTLSGEQAAGMLEGAIIKHKRERERDEDIFRLAQQRALEKHWQTSAEQQKAESAQNFQFRQDAQRAQEQARQDALAARSQELLLELSKINQQNAQFEKTLNKTSPHFGFDMVNNEPYALVVEGGKLKDLRAESASSLNRGNDSAGYRAILTQSGAKPSEQIQYPEALRDTDKVNRLKADIAEQDKILRDTVDNPEITVMPSSYVGGAFYAPPPATKPFQTSKYSSLNERRAAYAMALKRKKELQAELNALIPQSRSESPASGD